MAKEVNVLALVKGEEQYLFMFDDSNRVETLRLLGRYAADPELSFSWYDAAVLSQKIRSTMPTSSPKEVGSSQSMASSSHNTHGSGKPKQVRFQFPSFEQERLPELDS